MKNVLASATVGIGILNLLLGGVVKLMLTAKVQANGTGVNQAVGNAAAHVLLSFFGMLFAFGAAILVVVAIVLGLIVLLHSKYGLGAKLLAIFGILLAAFGGWIGVASFLAAVH